MYNYTAIRAHQIEYTTVEVLLKELVLALGLFVSDVFWLVPGVGPSLLLCHVMQLLYLFLLLLLPGWTRKAVIDKTVQYTRACNR